MEKLGPKKYQYLNRLSLEEATDMMREGTLNYHHWEVYCYAWRNLVFRFSDSAVSFQDTLLQTYAACELWDRFWARIEKLTEED